MICINCGNPIVGNVPSMMIPFLGKVSICVDCDAASQKMEQAIKADIEIEFFNPKTGGKIKQVYRSR